MTKPWGLRRHDDEIWELHRKGLCDAEIARIVGCSRQAIPRSLARSLKKKTPGDQPGACRCAYAQETTL